jgi:cyclophilin family peptidyl-prolyl cis-trans isomerase
MSPQLAGSMFTRMYFFNDGSLNHFNIFSKRTQITGGDVIVWKVDWSGKDVEKVDLEEDNMVQNVTMSGSDNPKVIFDTSMGEIELELFKDEAPKTVENFMNLSRKGFYDGVLFHRVIDGFMIQSGDPLTKKSDTSVYGTGGPGYSIKDESNKYTFDKTGILAMANAGPNTGGSQFFITVGQAQWLNGKHTIFGRVVKGYDVVQRIAKVKVNSKDMPVEKVIINKVTIVNP